MSSLSTMFHLELEKLITESQVDNGHKTWKNTFSFRTFCFSVIVRVSKWTHPKLSLSATQGYDANSLGENASKMQILLNELSKRSDIFCMSLKSFKYQSTSFNFKLFNNINITLVWHKCWLFFYKLTSW